MRSLRIGGMALIELLIACAVLLIMSALFFKGVVPVLKRSDWLSDSQTSQQFAIITKERLDLELDGVLLVNPLPGENLSIPPNVDPPLLAQWSIEYHRPKKFRPRKLAR